jgi:hypothetical protein
MPATALRRTDPASPQRLGRVPVEFIGRARQLRNRIADSHAEATAATEQLILPLRPRPDFAPLYGRSVLRVAAARWRALPAFGRLFLLSELDNGKLTLAEVRAGASRMSLSGWDAKELALSISLRTIDIAPASFGERAAMLAVLGLHALARRYQRGYENTDDSVLRDLAPIGREFVAAAATFGEFKIPAGGGRWIGAVANSNGSPVLAVRTFIA